MPKPDIHTRHAALDAEAMEPPCALPDPSRLLDAQLLPPASQHTRAAGGAGCIRDHQMMMMMMVLTI